MSLIYKIYCKDENIKDCYVGSTNNLNKRKRTHKHCCNNINSKNHNLKLYIFIKAKVGFENFDFIILEQFENIMIKQDLLKIEGSYIKNNNSTLNSDISGRTLKQYYIDNKEKINEYNNQYRQDNKKKLLEYHQKYRQDNKEKRKIYYKQKYEDIKEKLKEKVQCEFCKSLIRKDGLKRHQKTEKCLKVQNTNQI